MESWNTWKPNISLHLGKAYSWKTLIAGEFDMVKISYSSELEGKERSTPLRRPMRLSNEVYDAIFMRIMSLDIPPGARIAIDGMARELGVSQTPIREALTRLESEGLVNKQHLIGYSAAPQMTRKQFYETYEMRLLLEPQMASKAAKTITDESISKLENLAREMETFNKSEDAEAYAKFAQLDAAFHDLITENGDNTLVAYALSRLYTHVHLFRLFYHSRVTAATLQEHSRLLDALRRRNSEEAETAMREHIIRSRDRFKGKYPNTEISRSPV